MGQYEVEQGNSAGQAPYMDRGALVLDAKETTVTLPMKFDKAVRNLANQTLVIEIEANTPE